MSVDRDSVVSKFGLDAMLDVNGVPIGVLKESGGGNCNANSPNERFLYEAAQLVCNECPVKKDCAPYKVTANNRLGILKNIDVWIAGKKVHEKICKLHTDGVPDSRYNIILRSYGY